MSKTSASALVAHPHSGGHGDIPEMPRVGGHRPTVIVQDLAPGTPPGPYMRKRISAAPTLPGRSMRVSLPSVDRFGRSEARLLAAAITCAALFCGVLIVYLTAYAQVTMFGIRQAHNRVELRDKRLLNETLRAQCAALESPNRIDAKAKDMGMVIETRHVCYIEPGASPLAASKHSSVQVALAPGE